MPSVRSVALLLLFGVSFSCGGRGASSGRVSRVPRRPVAAPSPRATPAPPLARTPSRAPYEGVAAVEDLAPAPNIRVGLETAARVVRLTSSLPFQIDGPGGAVLVQDVLISGDSETRPGDSVRYRIQLGSLATEERARAERNELAEAFDEPIQLVRESETGRYALRIGSFTTEAGAVALREELLGRGFESVRVVAEVARGPRPDALVLRPRGSQDLLFSGRRVRAVPGALGQWIELDGQPYRGYLEISVDDLGELTVVNVLGLEDYLRGVVPAELSPTVFPEKEALKAQAIAARTYAVKRRGQFAAEGYDLCATPACQVYRGVAVEHELSDEAVRETRGEILTFNGEPVDALYTSTCGGRTENAENVFSTKTPYLVSRACFVESRRSIVRAGRGVLLDLESALLASLGIIDRAEFSGRDLDAPATLDEVNRWKNATISYLGQSQCAGASASVGEGTHVDVAGLAVLLSQSLCWEHRLPFLVSRADAERLVPSAELPDPDRRALAQAVREGLIRPRARGLSLGVALSRAEVVSTLFRLVESRGPPPLRDGIIRRTNRGSVVLRDEALADEDNEVVSTFSPDVQLYREANRDVYASESLILLPGDRVGFRTGERGIDVLVLRSDGASFDRSSRFSHWIVRKTAEELSLAVSERYHVGEVLDLRPRRYGQSGRVAELEIVGTAGNEVVRGLAIRRALGIRENLFFADPQRDGGGAVTAWIFTGRGWGHGVGMCQVGAYGMAAAGYDYRTILAQYYPGTAIQSVDNQGLTP